MPIYGKSNTQTFEVTTPYPMYTVRIGTTDIPYPSPVEKED